MKQIKVVHSLEHNLIDENAQAITMENINFTPESEELKLLSFLDMPTEDYNDVITYMSFENRMLFRLLIASDFKKYFPELDVLFFNEKQYFDIPIDKEGFSVIKENFDISEHALVNTEHTLKIMFHSEGTGAWDYKGFSIPLEWIPCSETTRHFIKEAQEGLNKCNFSTPYMDERNIKYYTSLMLKAAILLKQDLPDWTIYLSNVDGVYHLDVNEENNSEILIDTTYQCASNSDLLIS